MKTQTIQISPVLKNQEAPKPMTTGKRTLVLFLFAFLIGALHLQSFKWRNINMDEPVSKIAYTAAQPANKQLKKKEVRGTSLIIAKPFQLERRYDIVVLPISILLVGGIWIWLTHLAKKQSQPTEYEKYDASRSGLIFGFGMGIVLSGVCYAWRDDIGRTFLIGTGSITLITFVISWITGIHEDQFVYRGFFRSLFVLPRFFLGLATAIFTFAGTTKGLMIGIFAASFFTLLVNIFKAIGLSLGWNMRHKQKDPQQDLPSPCHPAEA